MRLERVIQNFCKVVISLKNKVSGSKTERLFLSNLSVPLDEFFDKEGYDIKREFNKKILSVVLDSKLSSCSLYLVCSTSVTNNWGAIRPSKNIRLFKAQSF